jgi:transposase
MPKGRYSAQNAIAGILEDGENNLPFIARELLNDLWQSIKGLNDEILKYDRKLHALANQMKDAKRLMSIPGIGEITATAVVATVNDAKHFDTRRSFAAWIGLVPRQYSTGGVARLGHISKRGEKHIRTSLIHGARAVIANCKNKTDRTSLWIKDLVERRGFKRATVALAAKNARLIWALLHSEKEYQVDYVK